MKILHVTNYYYPHIGGIEKTSQDIVKSLSGNFEQKVICFNTVNKLEIDEVDGVEIIRAPISFKILSQAISFKYKKILKKCISEYKPDAVIFHYPNPFVAHFLLKYAGQFKLYVWYHADIIRQKAIAWMFEMENKKLLNWATKIVCTSPNYLESSKNLIRHAEKCVVISSCIDSEKLKIDQSDASIIESIKETYKDKKIVFAFGRHVKYKGYRFLIDASKYLNDKYVVLIGGEGRLTKQLKKRSKGMKNVSLIGRLDERQIRTYISACDVFAFPSVTRNEAFGLALAESMYLGKPNVTFSIRGSGVNYVSLNGITGIEVENSNSQKLAEAIIKICDDDELRKTLGNNSHKRVIDNFMFDTFKGKVCELLDGGNCK